MLILSSHSLSGILYFKHGLYIYACFLLGLGEELDIDGWFCIFPCQWFGKSSQVYKEPVNIIYIDIFKN